MSTTSLPRAAVDYPSSDGKPMADNDWQRAAILYALGALQVRYAPRADVYVSGDLLIYYEEGNPRASVAPDVFVVFGAEARKRAVYKLWEEPKAPDFVLEVASPSTWKDDEGPKGELYARLGVREYWQYDPTGDLLPVRLRGRRRAAGGYAPQPVVESRDGTLMLRSETLGLDLLANTSGDLHFHDPETGRRLLGHGEAAAAHHEEAAARGAAESRAERESVARGAAESRAERESVARRAAEARVAALEALLGGKRG